MEILSTEFTNNFIYKYDKFSNNEYFIFNPRDSRTKLSIFVFNQQENKLAPIYIQKLQKNSDISNFHVLNNILIFCSSDKTEIYISYDNGKNLLSHKFKSEISQIYFKNKTREIIVIHDINNNVY